MSNLPKINLSLKVHNKLLKSGVQSQIVDSLADQLRTYLGSELQKHSRDIQLVVDICRALERYSGKIDKKLVCILILKQLFPGKIASDEQAILDMDSTIDTLHSLGLFEKKGVLGRLYKWAFVSQKKD